MSNERLLEAKILDKDENPIQGPFHTPMEKFQSGYEVKKFQYFPINIENIRHLADQMKFMLFRRVKVYENFVTSDGTSWIAIRAMVLQDADWYFLFPKKRDPKHYDGTVSGSHAAMYCDSPDEVTEQTLQYVSQALYALFEWTRRDHHRK